MVFFQTFSHIKTIVSLTFCNFVVTKVCGIWYMDLHLESFLKPWKCWGWAWLLSLHRRIRYNWRGESLDNIEAALRDSIHHCAFLLLNIFPHSLYDSPQPFLFQWIKYYSLNKLMWVIFAIYKEFHTYMWCAVNPMR